MLMIEPESTPRIEEIEASGAAGRFEIQPLTAGYGVTLGNALRRVLLSSLEGAAVTSIQVTNVFHEWIGIGKDLAGSRSPREAIGYLFGPPGWSPDGSRETSHTLKAKWRAREERGKGASLP